MSGTAKNGEVASLVSQRDKSLQYLQQLAERTVIEASELAEKIKQEAQSEADKVREEAEEKAQEIISEAQKQANNKMAEANKLAEGIKQEALREATKVMEEVEAAQKGVNAIIEALRKQILGHIDIIRDRFLPSLESLSADIAEGGNAIAEKKRAMLKVAEGLEAPVSGVLIADVKNNGHKEPLEVDLKSEFVAMAPADEQAIEKTIPADLVDKSTTLPPLCEASTSFEGEVEIAILPPVDMAQLIQLRRNILDTSHLKISRTAGSWNEGSVINVVVDKPLPLVNMLMEMSEVEKVELCTGEGRVDGYFPWNLSLESKSGNCQIKRIFVTLKKQLR